MTCRKEQDAVVADNACPASGKWAAKLVHSNIDHHKKPFYKHINNKNLSMMYRYINNILKAGTKTSGFLTVIR